MALKGIKQGSSPKTGPDYSQHLSSVPVMATVTHEAKIAGSDYKLQSSTEEVINKGVFVSKGNYFKVGVEGSRTLNLGNHEFARIGVTLTVPCDPDQLEAAWEFGTSWVSEKIDAAVKDAKGL